MANVVILELGLDSLGNPVYPPLQRTTLASPAAASLNHGGGMLIVSVDADTNISFGSGTAVTAADYPLTTSVGYPFRVTTYNVASPLILNFL